MCQWDWPWHEPSMVPFVIREWSPFGYEVTHCYSHLTWLNFMILFVIMFMLVVSLQVHSIYWPGMLCLILGMSNWIGVLPCLDRVHISIPVLWTPASSLFRCRVVVVIEAPLCSLNNVHIVQPHRECRLASQLDVISNYVPLVSIKRLFSVPRCCVLAEDMIFGLAMQGKPVALSRGATSLGIRAALTVGHARPPTC